MGGFAFRDWGVSAQVDIELSEALQLVSISAYRKYTSNFSNDNDVSPMAHSLGYGPLTFQFFSQELRLNGAIGETIEYTVGGYYSDQKSVYTSFQDLRSSNLQFQQSDPVDANSKAAFLHVAWTPIERLTLNGGVRLHGGSERPISISARGAYLDPTSVTANGVLPLNGTIGEYSGDRIDYRANFSTRSPMMSWLTPSTRQASRVAA